MTSRINFGVDWCADMTVLDERDAPRDQKLALPWLLGSVGLPPGSRVLDVGAGGFVGRNTTVHLRAIEAQITAVEIDVERASKLQEAFADIKVIVSDIRHYDYADGPFDLAVFDLDSGLTPAVMTELIQVAHKHLIRGGLLITVMVYDSAATYGGDKPLLGPAGRKTQEEFLNAFYGSTRVGIGLASRALVRHGFEVLGIVDKYLGAYQRGVGWLVLRKS